MEKSESALLIRDIQRLGLTDRSFETAGVASRKTIAKLLKGDPVRNSSFNRIREWVDKVAAEQASKLVGIVPKMLRPIPILSTITAGEPWDQHGDVEWEEMEDWGPEFERWGRVVEGDSMLPILKPGDRAIFENRRFDGGHVVHAFKDGRDFVKCYRQTGEHASERLYSFNEDYPPVDFDGWQVKGVCVARIRVGSYRIRSVTEFPGGLSWAMRNADF